jgi:hypothetical protein
VRAASHRRRFARTEEHDWPGHRVAFRWPSHCVTV